MKKILLISLMTINSPILSMLRTQQVVTLVFRNNTAIPRTMSTSQPPKKPCMAAEEIKKDNLTQAMTVGSATLTGIGIGTILGTMKCRNADKELMSETEKPKENNNDSDHD